MTQNVTEMIDHTLLKARCNEGRNREISRRS